MSPSGPSLGIMLIEFHNLELTSNLLLLVRNSLMYS
jgi:hypothetical protein